MKDIIKGGLACLLSCLFVGWINAQSVFGVQKEPGTDEYGTISTPELSSALIKKIQEAELTSEQWSTFFSIRTSSSTRQVLGDYFLDKNRLRFRPRFLPDPNVAYIVTFSYDQANKLLGTSVDQEELQEVISFELMEVSATQVLSFTPSADTLPSNLLRGYLHFSGPMSFENPYQFISLRNNKGTLIQDAFVELPEGLWNENRTRLTLLFHPGRIKRGVGPNISQGEILQAGESYQLLVSENWKDANGNDLAKSYSYEFIAGEPVRSVINISKWEVAANCIDSCEAILITDRTLDVEMASRFIYLQDVNDEKINFQISYRSKHELQLTSNDFQSGATYHLLINPKLEDVCGNTFLNPFDYPEGKRENEEKELKLAFKIE